MGGFVCHFGFRYKEVGYLTHGPFNQIFQKASKLLSDSLSQF